MKINVDSKIEIIEPSKEIIDFCNKELILKNPEIQKKKAMGFYTGNIQPTIKLYTKKNNNYILPIGCLENIWKINSNINDYNINFGMHEKIEFPELKFELYEYQKKAVANMIKYKRGILKANCGSGKSVCAIEIIRQIGYNALIIVQTSEILNQFKNYFINVMGLDVNDIGIIAAGKINIGSKVTIALRQTLCKIDLLQYKYQWGTIICDECQNISSNPTNITQYEKILNNLVAEYRISLSATPKRADGLTKAMFALCGNIKHEITSEEVADKTIKAKIQPIFTEYILSRECQKTDGTLDYVKMPTLLAQNKERNKLIVKLLKENKENYCLILSDRLEGLKQIKEDLGEGLLIDGSMTSKKAKKLREDNIEKIRNKEEHFLFATYNLARERIGYKMFK